jgi:predicted metal-dependent hydrolase
MRLQDMTYEIKRSQRARRLRLSVSATGAVRLTVPRFVSVRAAEHFLAQKQAWLKKVLAKVGPRVPMPLVCALPKEILLGYIGEQVAEYAEKLGLPMPRIRLMKAKTRWGSCSLKTRKIALNERLALAPAIVMNYVIAHEVAHLRYGNHSKKFWALVAGLCGDYKESRAFLKTFNPHTSEG